MYELDVEQIFCMQLIFICIIQPEHKNTCAQYNRVFGVILITEGNLNMEFYVLN